MSFKSKQGSLALGISLLYLNSCGYGINKYNPNSISIDIANASIDSNLEVATPASSQIIRLVALGTGTIGCSRVATVSDSTVEGSNISYSDMTSTQAKQAAIYVPNSYMKVTGAKWRLVKFGGPTGNIFATIQTANTNPTGTTLATSSIVALSSVTVNPIGAISNFLFTTPAELTANSAYSLVLNTDSGATIVSPNYYSAVTTGTAGECSAFALFRFSSDGSNWGDGSNSGLSKSYFNLNVETHQLSGSASWILKNTRNGYFDFSTFSINENPRTITTGTVTYDIGTGESETTPKYDFTGLTLAQVQGLNDVKASFLYLKVNLNVSSPGYNQAEIGAGAINTY